MFIIEILKLLEHKFLDFGLGRFRGKKTNREAISLDAEIHGIDKTITSVFPVRKRAVNH